MNVDKSLWVVSEIYRSDSDDLDHQQLFCVINASNQTSMLDKLLQRLVELWEEKNLEEDFPGIIRVLHENYHLCLSFKGDNDLGTMYVVEKVVEII